MIEYVPLLSNGVVIRSIWYSIRRAGKQEKDQPGYKTRAEKQAIEDTIP